MSKASSGPIFIVGPSRSGTAMMQSIMNQHPLVHIDGETHYFDDLRDKLGPRAWEPVSDEEARRCADYFLALADRPYGVEGDPTGSPIARERLTTLAKQIGPGGDAFFEAFCRLAADDRGKPRWGEKTPRHVFRLDDMLTLYADAQAICMVRDPRAVLASYSKWTDQGGFDYEKDPGLRAALERDERRSRRSFHPILMAMLWRGQIGAALAARTRFGSDRVRLVRYEDLVADPERTVRDVCKWLSLEYVPEMLEIPLHNSSFSAYDAGAGVSKAAVDRWREKITDKEIALNQRICGEVMRQAGYEEVATGAHRFYIVGSFLSLGIAVPRALQANRSRIGNVPAYIWKRLKYALRQRA